MVWPSQASVGVFRAGCRENPDPEKARAHPGARSISSSAGGVTASANQPTRARQGPAPTSCST
jgi:hypothetical protein